jgi:hypothetical protein
MRYVTFPMGFGDSEHYLEMAKSPGKFVGSPWGYRIAVPYAAALLAQSTGISLFFAFTLLQVGIYSLFLATLFFWLRRGLRVSNFAAGMTLLLFVCSYPGVYNLHNVVHVGLAEHLLVLLGCIAVYHNRFLLLALIVAISCTVKETVGMLLIPSYFILAIESGNWRKVTWNTAIVAAVFLSLSLGLRTGVLFVDKIYLHILNGYL